MKEKEKSLITKISDLKLVIKSASNYPPKRLKIIYSNTEYRLKEISGLDNKYFAELKEITSDCIKILDNNAVKDSFDTFSERIEGLLTNILEDSKAVPEILIK